VGPDPTRPRARRADVLPLALVPRRRRRRHQLASFYAAVARKTREGEIFTPEQRLTREEALRSYTLDNAYAAFEEDIKGSITPGKLADIVVLSKDIMTIPEDEILETRVVMTILGGEVRYRAEGEVAAR
jgi:predicted amidohydrolase YtcJ